MGLIIGRNIKTSHQSLKKMEAVINETLIIDYFIVNSGNKKHFR